MSTATSQDIILESGDRLTRAEFHRRYCLRPDIQKAELINGVVYVASPARNRRHGIPHGVAATWLTSFALRTAGVSCSVEATVYLDENGEVQPDALLYRPGHPQCRLRETDDDYLEGAPDLVIEVAASSASYDLHDRMKSYGSAGVAEYIVWRTIDGQLDWFRLHGGIYTRVQPNERGWIESAVFPGLRLNVTRLLAGDLAGAIAEE